jgi:hypothetical protein
MPQTLDLLPAARRIEREITRSQRNGQHVIQRTVNWLLDQFQLAHLDAHSAREMEARLADVGVRVEPSLSDVGQAASVNLTTASAASQCAIRHWELRVDGSVEATDYRSAVISDHAVHWFDVDLTCSAHDILAALATSCPGLTEEMVLDLMEPDVQPKAIAYGEQERSVSLIGVDARSRNDSTANRWSGELAFQLVESLSGPGWIITCWHNSRICSGTLQDRDAPPATREDVTKQLLSDWTTRRWKTSGDLGTGLASLLIETMPTAYRELEAWLQRWEMNHYRERCHGHAEGSRAPSPDTETLNSLLSLVSEFRRRAAAEENSRGVTEESPWFDGVTDVALDDRADRLIDGVLGKLDRLFENVRADMELVTMNSIAEQARASADQALEVAETTRLIKERGEADERFQSQLGKVTALLLVPTLIAGMFGANTSLPGGGSWFGFELMLVLMVISSLAVYLYIRPRPHADSLPETSVPEPEPAKRASAETIRGIVLANG